jgi:hypothetical protein
MPGVGSVVATILPWRPASIQTLGGCGKSTCVPTLAQRSFDASQLFEHNAEVRYAESGRPCGLAVSPDVFKVTGIHTAFPCGTQLVDKTTDSQRTGHSGRFPLFRSLLPGFPVSPNPTPSTRTRR